MAKKEKKKELFMIETVSTYKLVYAIEATSLNEAKKLAISNQYYDYDQKHLGEKVTKAVPLSQKRFETLRKKWDGGHMEPSAMLVKKPEEDATFDDIVPEVILVKKNIFLRAYDAFLYAIGIKN